MSATLRQPAPDEHKEELARLFDRSAPTYERTGVSHFADLGRRLVEHAGLREGERVLDVGCGTGAVLVPAARAVGPRGSVTGVDLSPGMVERTRAAIAEEGLGHARAFVADAETVDGLPGGGIADGSLDAVLAGISMFFFPHPRAAAARYRRLLGADGRLALSWWGEQDARWAPVFAASAPYGGASSHRLPPDSPFRSVEDLHTMLAEEGFGSVDTVERPCVTRFHGIRQWWQWVWSTAGRQFWESVPQERMHEAIADVEAELSRLRAPDGSLTSRNIVRFTVARAVR
ncbi:class I SAM-dependent methyltransferase [Streptomyces sp. NPDC021100]|uniref:class I SAM-dependent methyltransferase n=1 Tax=Streptomyces sp. NPDC021100 TaxID=3365114 RepID=UPI0037B72871